MPRAKRGFKRRRRHNKILDRAEGFVFGRKNKIRRTAEAVDRAFIYAYRDRRAKKRDFRALWIQRINAGAREHGMSYSELMGKIHAKGLELNRKTLADLAMNHPAAFKAVIDQVK